MSDTAASPGLPIIISSGPRSLPVASLAAQYYQSSSSGALDLVLLRPRACADFELPLTIRTVDDEAVPGFAHVRERLTALSPKIRAYGRSPGWYLQQYLKLAGIRHIAPQGAILTDGDTIFSIELLKDLVERPTVLTTKEKFGNYNNFVEAIGIAPHHESCVANGNVFYPALLPPAVTEPAGFLELVEQHVVASDGASDFSEYQLMGSILAPRLTTRRIRMFRRFDLLGRAEATPSIGKVTEALRRYDAIAIEYEHHRSVSRRVLASVLFRFGYSW